MRQQGRRTRKHFRDPSSDSSSRISKPTDHLRQGCSNHVGACSVPNFHENLDLDLDSRTMVQQGPCTTRAPLRRFDFLQSARLPESWPVSRPMSAYPIISNTTATLLRSARHGTVVVSRYLRSTKSSAFRTRKKAYRLGPSQILSFAIKYG
jgi:hypothetical protein